MQMICHLLAIVFVSVTCSFQITESFVIPAKFDYRHRVTFAKSRRLAASGNVDTYAFYWDNLLSEEHAEAVQENRERRASWSRQRLEASGQSLFDASAEPDSDLFGEKLVKIYKAQCKSPLRDRFTRGDVLLMVGTMGRRGFSSKLAATNAAVPKEVSVVDVGTDWMIVAVGPSWPAGLWESRKTGYYEVRLDRTAPKAPLLAQKKALDEVRKGKAGRAAEILVETFYCAPAKDKSENRDKSTASSSHLLCSSIPPRFANGAFCGKDGSIGPEMTMDEAIRKAISDAKENASSSFQPNKSQEEAIAWSLGRSLSLIRGPPGTGKTRCAALLIAAALRVHGKSTTNDGSPVQSRVLAVAHSNGAADVLLQALLNIGIPAVRVGRPANVAAELRHRTITAMSEKHPQILALREKARDRSLESYVRSTALYEIQQTLGQVRRSIAETAPVVVSSCIGAHQLMEGDSDRAGFPIVVLDEAAQTTEPALLCALAAARAEQVILIGDTRQLPPTVASDNRKLRNSLGVSPMLRLEKNGNVEEQTLTVQYRMPSSLLEHPSRYFYNGLVTCADGVSKYIDNAGPPAGFPWPNASLPLAFVEVSGNREFEVTHDFGGKSNPTEATLVVNIVSNFKKAEDPSVKNIAVISPYAKQVDLIRSELSANRVKNVRVGTVDSFQGQETDIVVISSVRSNTFGEIGFLRDPRRLCVAITRARRGLIILGDSNVLKSSRHWVALIESCEKRGCVMGYSKLLSDRRNDKATADGSEAATDEDLVGALLNSLGGDDDEFGGLFG